MSQMLPRWPSADRAGCNGLACHCQLPQSLLTESLYPCQKAADPLRTSVWHLLQGTLSWASKSWQDLGRPERDIARQAVIRVWQDHRFEGYIVGACKALQWASWPTTGFESPTMGLCHPTFGAPGRGHHGRSTAVHGQRRSPKDEHSQRRCLPAVGPWDGRRRRATGDARHRSQGQQPHHLR